MFNRITAMMVHTLEWADKGRMVGALAAELYFCQSLLCNDHDDFDLPAQKSFYLTLMIGSITAGAVYGFLFSKKPESTPPPANLGERALALVIPTPAAKFVASLSLWNQNPANQNPKPDQHSALTKTPAQNKR